MIPLKTRSLGRMKCSICPVILGIGVLLVGMVAGQNLPNLRPLNGRVNTGIEEESIKLEHAPPVASFFPSQPGDFFADAPPITISRPQQSPPVDLIQPEELLDVLREGFIEAGVILNNFIDNIDDFDIPSEEIPVPPTPQDFSNDLLNAFRKAKEEASSASCTGVAINLAFQKIKEKHTLTVTTSPNEIVSMLFDVDECERLAKEHCRNSIMPPADCDPSSPYRTINGACNNLNKTDQGMTNRRMGRYHPPIYEDVVSEPRVTGLSSFPLPNARDVSLLLHSTEVSLKSPNISYLVMQWGQFVDHDLVHIPESEKKKDMPFKCCGKDQANKECFPILTKNLNDTVSQRHNRTCIQCARSVTAPITSCQYVYREQSNQVTSYMDGSQIYGSSKKEEEKLRHSEGGKMKTFDTSEIPIPRSACPVSGTSVVLPVARSENIHFEAGDTRVNEHPGLTTMHTLWVRIHNAVAKELSEINPHWDHERLYQESRRIISALVQHVTYKEWLPIILDPVTRQKKDLNPRDGSAFTKYDPSMDATIINSFATAAFRFGHSLVSMELLGQGRNVQLKDNFFNPNVVCEKPTRTSALLEGLALTPAENFDEVLVPALTNHLFRGSDLIGLDLAALNIQRGRDHGLPGYLKWRELCDLDEFFYDYIFNKDLMKPEVLEKLRKLYPFEVDIDLFAGGMSERSVSGGLVGPTFACIIAEQFSALKKGDRFYYEHEGQAGSFTSGQLRAIRQTTLSSLICHHTDIEQLQPKAFLLPSQPGNELRMCASYPKLKLNRWKETVTSNMTTTPKPGFTPTPGTKSTTNR
ncbi:peroxidase-like isoform X2 [Oratosquilla oratoria]|uniref:peroxidase-like isoform X2 n=1 Tax=Oratosquilla oratoria TaxID=337810 RepID=UPI003F76F60C